MYRNDNEPDPTQDETPEKSNITNLQEFKEDREWDRQHSHRYHYNNAKMKCAKCGHIYYKEKHVFGDNPDRCHRCGYWKLQFIGDFRPPADAIIPVCSECNSDMVQFFVDNGYAHLMCQACGKDLTPLLFDGMVFANKPLFQNPPEK